MLDKQMKIQEERMTKTSLENDQEARGVGGGGWTGGENHIGEDFDTRLSS